MLTAADKLHYDFLETLTPFLLDIVTLANKPITRRPITPIARGIATAKTLGGKNICKTFSLSTNGNTSIHVQ